MIRRHYQGRGSHPICAATRYTVRESATSQTVINHWGRGWPFVRRQMIRRQMIRIAAGRAAGAAPVTIQNRLPPLRFDAWLQA